MAIGVRIGAGSPLWRGVLRRLAPRRAPQAGAPRLEPLEIAFEGHPFDPFQVRSEDIRFSPSGRLVAVVSTAKRILLFEVDTGARPVRAELLTTFVSTDLDNPHGVDWVDEEHLVVANRSAGIAFFRIPQANRWEAETPISAVSKVHPHWFGQPGETRLLRKRKVVTGAGSARIHDGHVYVGSNNRNTITRHRITPGPSCTEGELVAQQGIEIPDSAQVSPDGRWLAVGDHDHARILIFRLGQPEPVGELTDRDMLHPHGTTFDPTGTVLISADAGGPLLHVFHAPDGDWSTPRRSVASNVEGVAGETFRRVQSETARAVRALEGGTKGIDMARDGRTVLATCRGQTLSAFALHV